MSNGALVWAATGLVLLVLLILSGLQLAAAVREGRRAADRVGAYADLPVVAAARKAEADVKRLERAATEADLLAFRAAMAIESIRRGLAVLRLFRPL